MPVPLSRLLRLTPPARSDRDLVRAHLAGGDPAAFDELVRRHAGLARRVAAEVYPAAAEDVAQITLTLLARKAAAVAGRESAAGWVFETARRLALKARTAAARRAAHEGRANPPEPPADPLDALTLREVRAAVAEELARLPDELRLPLLLCYWEGAARPAAAARLGCSVSTLKRRLDAGRDQLAARLARRGFAGSAVLAALTALQAGAEAAVPVVLAAVGRGLAPWKVLAAVVLAAGVAAAGVGIEMSAPVAADPPGEPAKPVAPPPVVAARPGPAVDRYGDPLPAGAVTRFGTARFRHGQSVYAVAFSPAGDEVVSASFDGTIRVWETASGKELRRVTGLDTPAFAAYTRDGRHLLVSVGARSARGKEPEPGLWLYAAATAKPVRRLFDGVIARPALSPDRSVIAFTDDRAVTLLAVPSGERLRALEVGRGVRVTHLAFSPDGARLAVSAVTGDRDGAQEPNAVRVYDPATGALVWEREGRAEPAAGAFPAAAFAPDGKTVAASFAYKEHLKLLDAATGKDVRAFVGATVGCWPFTFSADGTRLLSNAWGGRKQVWDVATGRSALEWGDGESLFDLSLAPDGKTVATAGPRRVRLWEATTGRPRVADEGPAGTVEWLSVFPDGLRVLAGGGDEPGAAFRVWDLRTGRVLLTHGPRAATAALSPDGTEVAVADYGGAARVVDPVSGRVLRAAAKSGGARWLGYSLDGKHLGRVGWPGGGVGTADARALREEPPLPGAERGVAAAFFPDGKRVAVAAEERGGLPINPANPPPAVVTVFDLATRQPVRRLEGLVPGYPMAVAVSPDERRVAAVSADTRYVYAAYSSDRHVRVWDGETGTLVLSLPGSTDGHRCVAFSPDGRLVGAGGEDYSVRVWEVAGGGLRARLRGHDGPATALAFTPDGRCLLSGSSDTSVLVWDVATPPAGRPDPGDLWADLRSADAAAADRAVRHLAARPEDAVSLLRRHLRPLPRPDPARVAGLVQDLGDPAFARRESAEQELTPVADSVVPDLRQATRSDSAEVRQRAQRILAAATRPVLTGEPLREVRAVEALERAGTADARVLLEELARGAGRRAEEAKAALKRLRPR
ncbi:MAG: hypothetical protein JWO38_8225 [Gemmataceae bacterium]|nr:hypothetical protein [Gemmataceae bacterium]